MKSENIPNRVGPYSVERLIGEGGCARVVLGRSDAGRTLALKIIPGLALHGQRDSKRFRREIKVLSEFSHPNLVRILDAGFDGEWFYYGMEYLEGGTLQDRMRLGPVSLPSIVSWVSGMADALGFLHE